MWVCQPCVWCVVKNTWIYKHLTFKMHSFNLCVPSYYVVRRDMCSVGGALYLLASFPDHPGVCVGVRCSPQPQTSCLLVCAGEMEVVGSPEAGVIDRDPLSQPVHCEWACVLVFCSCEALQGTWPAAVGVVSCSISWEVSHLLSPLQVVRGTLSSSGSTSADKVLGKAKPSWNMWGWPEHR